MDGSDFQRLLIEPRFRTATLNLKDKSLNVPSEVELHIKQLREQQQQHAFNLHPL